ncbi:MAG: hypothetical protein AAB361_02285 [Patescibacteria group bacterium]
MVNKILGYVLLIAGLIIIGWTLFQSYNIFIGKISAPLVFKTQPVSEIPGSNKNLNLQEQLQKQMEEAVKQQIGQIIPASAIIDLLNLISWSILAGILILGGGQIAGLGIKMIK